MTPSPPRVHAVDTASYATLAPGLWVLDFSAERCAPCRALAPVLDALADEYAGRARFGLIDVDADPALAERFLVRSMPTVVLVRDGREVGRVVGLRPRGFLAGVIDRALAGDVAIAAP